MVRFALTDGPEIRALFGGDQNPRIVVSHVLGDGCCFYRSHSKLLNMGCSPIESREMEVQWILENRDSVMAWNMTVEQVITSFQKCTVEEYCKRLLDPKAEQEGGVLSYRWGTELELYYMARFEICISFVIHSIPLQGVIRFPLQKFWPYRLFAHEIVIRWTGCARNL